MKLIAIRKGGDAVAALRYIHSIWGNPENYGLYRESICGCPGSAKPLPHWFVLEEAGEIIGCAGLVESDFVLDRHESPWLCALYVDPMWRCRGLAGQLMGAVEQAARESGFEALYLCTQHVNFYERYNYEYDGTGTYENGASERIYKKRLA